VTRAPDFAPAAALLAYRLRADALRLRPRCAAACRRRAQDRRADDTAQRGAGEAPTELDPKGADGFVALAYANMVQRRMVAAEGRLPASACPQPEPGRRTAWLEPASGRDGTHQGIVGNARSSAAIEAVHHQLHGRHRRDHLARRRYRKAVAMLQPFPAGTHARARAGAGLGRPIRRSRNRDPRNAGRKLSARDDGGGGQNSRIGARQAAAPADLPRLGI